MNITHKSSKRDRIAAQIAMLNSINSIAETQSENAEAINDLKVVDGKHNDPSCTAINNPVFSSIPYEFVEFNENPLSYTFQGHLAGSARVGDFILAESGAMLKITSVTQFGTIGINPTTVINVADTYNPDLEEVYIFYLQTSSSATGSNATGQDTLASYPSSNAEGKGTQAKNSYAHAEGFETIASGVAAHAEGVYSRASMKGTHSEGIDTEATSMGAHAEGYQTKATYFYAHAEGDGTTASGVDSHAEGIDTIASGNHSHAEGEQTTASGQSSHAEGKLTVASMGTAHAEGSSTIASGLAAHAEGYFTSAVGVNTHSGGKGANSTNLPVARGQASFNHQEVTSGSGIKETTGDNSAILGGKNNSTASTAVRSVVLGGESQNATLADTVYLPGIKLKPRTLPVGLVAADAGLIVCDSADTNKIKYWNGTVWTAL